MRTAGSEWTGRYCSEVCYAAFQREVDAPRPKKAGIAKLAMLRTEGKDPAHGGEARKPRSVSNAHRAQQTAAWEQLGLDVEAGREHFKRDILPGLRDVAISRIMKATGFSRRYASLVRHGLYFQHPVHNESLAGMLDSGK